jgi:hypothetical protein
VYLVRQKGVEKSCNWYREILRPANTEKNGTYDEAEIRERLSVGNCDARVTELNMDLGKVRPAND